MSWASFAMGVVVGVLLVCCCVVAYVWFLFKDWDPDDPYW